jgi:hypothetical protein
MTRTITDPFADTDGYRRLVYEVLSRRPATKRIEVHGPDGPSADRLSGRAMRAIDADIRALVAAGEPLSDDTALPAGTRFRATTARHTLVILPPRGMSASH